MKVSDYITEFFIEKKIDKIFSYIGRNAHICDSIDKYEEIENVFNLHEQGSGFAADAYARVTGKTAVCTVSSGPGATNLITTIADCYFDSVPVIFIVGDVPKAECKGTRNIRQFGFQETDIVTLSESITKYSTSIDMVNELRYKLEKAYFLSQEGRKGPILISIPENLQFIQDYNPLCEPSFFESSEYQRFLNRQEQIVSLEKETKEVARLINESKQPLILIGGGVRLADAKEELKELLEKSQIPIVYSLMGKDIISDDYEYNLGFIGNFGVRHANLTVANCDLLIVLGSRLDNLQTGRKVETFARAANIVQVDIDKNELGIRLNIDLPIVANVKLFLQQLNQYHFDNNIQTWHKHIINYKKMYPSTYTLESQEKLGNLIISQLSESLYEDDIICVDVGEHQMLVAQSLKTKDKQRILFSGAFGSMGFALPAAIGASLGTGRRVIVITGDGGFQMNIQELEVIKRRKLPIKIFVINNASLHMVKLRQDTYMDGNSVGSIKDYSVPSFKSIAQAYGILAMETSGSNIETINETVKESLCHDFPTLVDIHINADETTVTPRLDFNRPFEEMTPYLEDNELKELMIIE